MASTFAELATREILRAETLLAEGELRLARMRQQVADYDRRGLKLRHSKRLLRNLAVSYDLQRRHVSTLRREIAKGS